MLRFGGGAIQNEKGRSGRFGTVEELAKRKRESSGEGGEMREGEELFKKGNKSQRSPEGVGEAEGGGMEEMIERWREEMGR